MTKRVVGRDSSDIAYYERIERAHFKKQQILLYIHYNRRNRSYYCRRVGPRRGVCIDVLCMEVGGGSVSSNSIVIYCCSDIIIIIATIIYYNTCRSCLTHEHRNINGGVINLISIKTIYNIWRNGE